MRARPHTLLAHGNEKQRKEAPNLGPRLVVELVLALPARHGGDDPGRELLERPPRRLRGEAEVLHGERAHRAPPRDEAVPGGPDAAAQRRDGAEPRHDHAAARGRARRRERLRRRGGGGEAPPEAEERDAAEAGHQAPGRGALGRRSGVAWLLVADAAAATAAGKEEGLRSNRFLVGPPMDGFIEWAESGREVGYGLFLD